VEETKLDETTKSNDPGTTEVIIDDQTNINEPRPSQSANVALMDNISGDMTVAINEAQNIETQSMPVEEGAEPDEILEDQSLFDLLYGVIDPRISRT
jgi:hypothetical protein